MQFLDHFVREANGLQIDPKTFLNGAVVSDVNQRNVFFFERCNKTAIISVQAYRFKI